jgi:hypothetical protein
MRNPKSIRDTKFAISPIKMQNLLSHGVMHGMFFDWISGQVERNNCNKQCQAYQQTANRKLLLFPNTHIYIYI